MIWKSFSSVGSFSTFPYAEVQYLGFRFKWKSLESEKVGLKLNIQKRKIMEDPQCWCQSCHPMQWLLSQVPWSPVSPLCWAGTNPVQLDLSPGEGVPVLSRSSSLSGQTPPTHSPWRSGSAQARQRIPMLPQGHTHTYTHSPAHAPSL